jgi:hypothetical protein
MSRLTRVRFTIAAALVAGLITGCKREPTSTPASALFANDPFFIRGSVSEVGKPWGNLVTGEPGTSYKTDRAYFRITPETEFVRADGSAATVADVKVGTKITLWITGPIMESYPVQVAAQRILIE